MAASSRPWLRSGIAWEQSLTAEQRGRTAALLAALPDDEEARCHMREAAGRPTPPSR